MQKVAPSYAPSAMPDLSPAEREARPIIVRIVVDPTMPLGKYRVGGVRIVHCPDDAALGRELRTQVVTCGSAQEAERLHAYFVDDATVEVEAR